MKFHISYRIIIKAWCITGIISVTLFLGWVIAGKDFSVLGHNIGYKGDLSKAWPSIIYSVIGNILFMYGYAFMCSKYAYIQIEENEIKTLQSRIKDVKYVRNQLLSGKFWRIFGMELVTLKFNRNLHNRVWINISLYEEPEALKAAVQKFIAEPAAAAKSVADCK